jgi:hypothetical protein
MNISSTEAHLTYCLNVYPSGSLTEIKSNILQKAGRVKDLLTERGCLDGPFGVGLWIPAALTEKFSQPSFLDPFQEELRDRGLYVFTMNGFPYGVFHDQRVKEQVYRPDWSTPEREAYTRDLAGLLADLLPPGVPGSISTVPVTFKAWANPEITAQAIERLVNTVAVLHSIDLKDERLIQLALEPEPGCYLETLEDTIAFFTQHVFRTGAARLQELLAVSGDKAQTILRRHLGICLDLIHTAVMFEKPETAIADLTAEGIPISKIHLGGAVQLEVPDLQTARECLAPFTDEVYFHQTCINSGRDRREFHADLPEALNAGSPGSWRVHYHVPLSGSLPSPLKSTADTITPGLLSQALDAGVKHFEVEIYTLNLLPGFKGDVETVMADEIEYVLKLIKEGSEV